MNSPSAPTRVWSDKQLAIFADVRHGTGNTIVPAVPGSGKSTTIREALNHVPLSMACLVVAFSKEIADTMKLLVPKDAHGRARANVSTLHTYGFQACKHAFPGIRLYEPKGKEHAAATIADTMPRWVLRRTVEILSLPPFRAQILEAERNLLSAEHKARSVRLIRQEAEAQASKELSLYAGSLVKCVGLSKSHLAHTAAKIEKVMDLFDILPTKMDESDDEDLSFGSIDQNEILPSGPVYAELSDRGAFVNRVIETFRRCKKDVKCVDFNDMIWFPYVHKLNVFQYDFVLVDETQDLTPAQIALVLKSIRKGGRGMAVGDPNQSVFQFAGAGDDSMAQVQKALNAKVLPLSVSYRCAKAIVAEAAKIAPEIEAAPGAPEGVLESCDKLQLLKNAAPGDFILSRTTAPLVELCVTLLGNGKRAYVKGHDVGTKIAGVILRTKAAHVDVMLKRVAHWGQLETKRLEERDMDPTAVLDTVACIRTLAEGEVSVKSILAKIAKLFSDENDANRIVLSTAHKAKGLEADRVWLLRATFGRSKNEKDQIAEKNLLYVAITRAKTELYMVADKKAGPARSHSMNRDEREIYEIEGSRR